MKALSSGMKGYLSNKRPMTAPLSAFRDKDLNKVATGKSSKNQFYSYAGRKPKRKKKRKARRKITEGTTTTCGCGRPVKFAVPLLCEDCWITKTFVRRA